MLIETEQSDNIASGQGTVTLRSWHAQAAVVLDKLIELLAGQSLSARPQLTRSWDGINSHRSLTEKSSPATGLAPVVQRPLHYSGRTTDAADADAFDDSDEVAQKPPGHRSKPGGSRDREPAFAVERLPAPDAESRTQIYISYAWGDDTSDEGRRRQQAVDQLEEKLREWGYQPILDRDQIHYGQGVDNYMVMLGRAPRVLVILSNQYLRSIACMTELHHLYNRALEHGDEFLQRIILVVLDEVRFSQPEDRAVHQRHWRERAENLRTLLAAGDLGGEDATLLTTMDRWRLATSDMLSLLNSRRGPRTWSDISANDFAAVRKMLPPPGTS
ncbi:MAG: toll/interleukin-1 receptor domain-containing protein [Planctomycetota bacterium]|nr:toll/interleukin-1 receptor domain-containing protein [Planctomycetota bacterium]